MSDAILEIRVDLCFQGFGFKECSKTNERNPQVGIQSRGYIFYYLGGFFFIVVCWESVHVMILHNWEIAGGFRINGKKFGSSKFNPKDF